MKKITLMVIFSVCLLNAMAQKNELYFSPVVGEYYFDNTGYACRGGLNKPFVYLTYAQNIHKNMYLLLKVQVRPAGEPSYNALFRSKVIQARDIDVRQYHNIGIGIKNKLLNFKKFSVAPEALIFLRNGAASYFLYDFGLERVYGLESYYGNVGLSLGSIISYPISKHFTLNGEVEYTQFLSKNSPEQFLTTLSVGYRFGGAAAKKVTDSDNQEIFNTSKFIKQ